MRDVHILTTGGTIDKMFRETDGKIINQKTLVTEFLLPHLRLPATRVGVTEVMAKDSLHMTPDDRLHIYHCIEKKMQLAHPLVVLHGTDTLAQTLRFCFDKQPTPPVTVVFTGAMRPAGFAHSDALQNLTEALLAAQTAASGFYVAFHGQLLPAPHIAKDKNQGTFVSTAR